MAGDAQILAGRRLCVDFGYDPILRNGACDNHLGCAWPVMLRLENVQGPRRGQDRHDRSMRVELPPLKYGCFPKCQAIAR